jgi:hypothetical protein
MNECKEFSFPKSGGGGDEGNNKEITVCELMENILQSSITGTEGGLQEPENNDCNTWQSEKCQGGLNKIDLLLLTVEREI